MRGLYAIIDADSLNARAIPAIPFAERLLAARPAAVQLRAKSASARETLGLLRELASRARAAGIPLFANDRPDLAVLAGCDGVHVGQEDLPVPDVRRFAPSLRVGVSTHDLAQLERALALCPDYVAYGPVFPTASKDRPDPVVGLAGLEAAARLTRAAGVPLVAIGGIDLSRAASVAAHAEMGAVIGALLPPASGAAASGPAASGDDPYDRATALHGALGGAPSDRA